MTTYEPAGLSEDSPDQSADPRRWIALGIIGVAQLMIILDASIVNIALPSAQSDLGISDADRQWVVTAYTLAFGALLLLGGRVADYLGRKSTLIVGLLGFAAASALGGVASTAGLLYAARGLQGAFAALMAPAALALLSVTFTSSKERAAAFGVFGAISGGGAAVGMVLGGVLTEYASWRWCLGVNVPIALATAAGAWIFVRESKVTGTTKYDIPGALLVTTALLALVYGFTEAAKEKNPGVTTEVVGWGANSTISYLATALVLLVAFVLWERRTEHPLLPLSIVLDRNRGGSYIVFALVGASLFAMFLFLTFYFQTTLGYSPLKSGFAFLPFSLGIIAAAGLVTRLMSAVAPRVLIAAGLAGGTLGFLLLAIADADSAYVTNILPALILVSVGMAFVFIPTSSTALVGTNGSDAGVASAMLNTAQQIGGSLGTALISTIYASTVTSYVSTRISAGESPEAAIRGGMVEGYHTAFFWGAALIFVALVTAGLLINATKDDLPAESAVPV